ncbi:transcriptional regulator, GntR family [Deferribacter desulfuricans SSM1]|uniref:Transcriptional regulator, GntR family n=1 Tax=Deferribacter desulfuricans (strain DSM 14783 / JCM 11476 / NBRC 101012 / SSM1) TaxID=639282 RepID=D3P9B7_DEFDS|nr:GntR family transcriptional regulator [Deferribacter desulfuricans]BAI81307.1 transcriptional regulator, GntR family [Deferribacter desulfuricans SSM1]
MFDRETYKDKVKKFIFEMILKREFNPGDQIRESSIAAMLNISRAPVREAFRELIAERILEYKPHKGTFLRKLTPKEIINIYTTRGVLEGYAVADAMFKISDEDLDILDDYVKQMYRAAKADDNSVLIDIGDKFHELLFTKCENELLVYETKRLSFRSHVLFSQNWGVIYTPNEIKKRHIKIINSIKSDNKKLVEEVIREHYLETGQKIALRAQ